MWEQSTSSPGVHCAWEQCALCVGAVDFESRGALCVGAVDFKSRGELYVSLGVLYIQHLQLSGCSGRSSTRSSSS